MENSKWKDRGIEKNENDRRRILIIEVYVGIGRATFEVANGRRSSLSNEGYQNFLLMMMIQLPSCSNFWETICGLKKRLLILNIAKLVVPKIEKQTNKQTKQHKMVTIPFHVGMM